MDRIEIGWSQIGITPTRPVLMEGQMYQRCSEYVHDPITATALCLKKGTEQAIFVSLDMTEPPVHIMDMLREALKPYEEIDFEKISFNVTHTHNSSSFAEDFMRVENEMVYEKEILPHFDMAEDMLTKEEAQRYLVSKLVELITDAWEGKQPGGISYAHEYAAVAFNRRPCFLQDEKSVSIMYGDCSREDFIGFENGVDTSVELMYTWNQENEVTGVICNVPCPSQVYELHRFISADYWGAARSKIREKLGKGVYVLPFCGAAGDLAPIDLVHISKTNRQALKDWGGQSKEVFRNFDMTLICQGIGERISEAVVRGYRTAINYIEKSPAFVHEVVSMELPIRQVSEEDYQEALKEVEQIHAAFSKEHPMSMKDVVRAFEPQGVILRYRQQKVSGVYKFQSHFLRIGNVAIATNPFELYHQFAQRIKARARAEQVFIVQLANGTGGYLPTWEAVNGGSYSSRPASTTCGPDGGDMLVKETLQVLDGFWSRD